MKEQLLRSLFLWHIRDLSERQWNWIAFQFEFGDPKTLGLKLTSQHARQLKGAIAMDGVEDKGTVFRITFSVQRGKG